jgi:hypothetical protein
MRRRHRGVHAAVWTVLGLGLPVLLLAMLALHPRGRDQAPAVPLDAVARAVRP